MTNIDLEFFRCVAKGEEVQAIQLLAQVPAVAHAETPNKITTLQAAIISGLPRLFYELINLDVDFSHTDVLGNTVLWTAVSAAYKGDAYYLQRLLPRFSDVHHKNVHGLSVWELVQDLQIPWLIEMVRPYA